MAVPVITVPFRCMYLAHLSVSGFPAEGTSVGRYVRAAVDVLRRSGLKFEVHAMGTEIECERLSDLHRAIEQIDEALVKMGAQRVSIQVKIDDRRDKKSGLSDKVKSALRSPGKPAS